MNEYRTQTLKPNILVVDDTPFSLHLLSTILRGRGFDVFAVSLGTEAVSRAKASLPDLILLDIRMPGMDGYEVCSRLKADYRTREIPVIFISSLNEAFDKVKAFAVGGVDYVTKPFHAEEVLARVWTHLQLREQKMLLEREVGQRRRAEDELRSRNQELEIVNKRLSEALDHVKKLSGLLPICAACKKIRDDAGYWHKIEAYIRDHSEADFSHSICPECARELYPDLDLQGLE